MEVCKCEIFSDREHTAVYRDGFCYECYAVQRCQHKQFCQRQAKARAVRA